MENETATAPSRAALVIDNRAPAVCATAPMPHRLRCESTTAGPTTPDPTCRAPPLPRETEQHRNCEHLNDGAGLVFAGDESDADGNHPHQRHRHGRGAQNHHWGASG